jgi:hypothetical protein
MESRILTLPCYRVSANFGCLNESAVYLRTLTAGEATVRHKMATRTGAESLNMMQAADVKVQGADTVRGPTPSPSVFISVIR